MADTEEVPGVSSAEVKDPEVKEKSEILSVGDTEEVPGTEEIFLFSIIIHFLQQVKQVYFFTCDSLSCVFGV